MKAESGRAAVVVAFEMGSPGHLQPMLTVIASLVRAGCTVHVYTTGWMMRMVTDVGAHAHDIYAREPLRQLDRETVPSYLRWVTFAGRHAHALAEEVRGLGPDLILHDSWAPVGAAVAARLGLPRVAVIAAHAQPPRKVVETTYNDFDVRCSVEAMRAARVLRDDFGLQGETPLDLLTTLSPDLNLYGEPPQFLDAALEAEYGPIAFFGSVWPERPASGLPACEWRTDRIRLLVSFGTVCWRLFPNEVRATLAAVSHAVAGMDGVEAMIGLGADDPAKLSLGGPHVTVMPLLDQWRALAGASLFMTHHGLNSTHEAIWHQVPMISAPFCYDQPGLARRCQQLGLALPLAEPRVAVPTPAQVQNVLEHAIDQLPVLGARLAEARTWESSVMAQRPTVIARILRLSGQTPSHLAPVAPA